MLCCYAHRIHLAIVATAREVQYEFRLINVLLARENIHESRLVCHYRNVLYIKERFGVIVDVLDEAQNLGDPEIRVQAKYLIEQLQSCQFVVNLCLYVGFYQARME